MEFITDSQYYEITSHKGDAVNIFFGGKENIVKGFKFGPYIHDFYCIEYCLCGGYTVYIKDTPIQIKEGDLFLAPPYTCIDKHFTGELTSTLYLNLKGDELEAIFSELGFSNNNYLFPHKIPAETVSKFEQIVDLLSSHVELMVLELDTRYIPQVVNCENTSAAPIRRRRRRGLFQLFIADLMDLCNIKNDGGETLSPKEIHLKKAVMFIENNYNMDITVNDVAKYVNLNRSYLYGLFEENLGMSIQEFIIRTRIRNACLLLMDKSIPIQSVAASVKYDPIYFSHIFKKVMGISPRQYRNKVSNRKNI